MPSNLVLVPTRELAVQVHQALSTYAASTSLRLAAIFGGVVMNGQVHALRRGVDIAIATPGRLLDHLKRRTLDPSGINMLTLDGGSSDAGHGVPASVEAHRGALPRRCRQRLHGASHTFVFCRPSAARTASAKSWDSVA